MRIFLWEVVVDCCNMQMEEHLINLNILETTGSLGINKSIIDNPSQTITLIFHISEEKFRTLNRPLIRINEDAFARRTFTLGRWIADLWLHRLIKTIRCISIFKWIIIAIRTSTPTSLKEGPWHSSLNAKIMSSTKKSKVRKYRLFIHMLTVRYIFCDSLLFIFTNLTCIAAICFLTCAAFH